MVSATRICDERFLGSGTRSRLCHVAVCAARVLVSRRDGLLVLLCARSTGATPNFFTGHPVTCELATKTPRDAPTFMQMPASQQPAVVDIAGLKIAIYESEEMSGKSGYATRLWDCSVGLAQWMTQALVASNDGGPLTRPLKGQRVLELGAGTGLVSLALLSAEPEAKVTASEIDPAALPLMRAAAEHVYEQRSPSSAGSRLQASIIDVCDGAPLPECDLLIACDVCYTDPLSRAIARRCVEVLRSSPQATAVVACPGRPHRHALLNELAALGVHERFEEPGGSSFAEWMHEAASGELELHERLRLLHIEDDARLWGVSCMPGMY